VNFGDLEQQFREWMDDPYGDVWGSSRVRRLIRAAYLDILLIVDQCPYEWDGPSSYTDLSVVAATREYVVTGVRVLIDAHRLNPEGTEGAEWLIHPYGERNKRSRGCYSYRRYYGPTETHQWFLGICAQPSPVMTLRVRGRPELDADRLFMLDRPEEEPLIIPFEFQHLIALRAAVLARAQRPARQRARFDVAGLWVEGRANLIRALGGAYHPSASGRF